MKKGIISLCAVVALLSMVLLSGCDKILKVVSVKTLQYSSLASTSVVIKGEVVAAGSGEVDERGFFYSTSKSLANPLEAKCGPGGKGEFEFKLTGLQPNTTYYYQAYAKSDEDMDVGDVFEFITYDLDFTIETLQPVVVNPDSVIFKGNYVNNENLNIEKLGFEYSKFGDYSNSTIVYAEGIQSPFSKVVSLNSRTTYYYRAFVQAEDSTLVLFGESKPFQTTELDPPVVTTEEATQVTDSTVRLNASIDYEGRIDMKGFYWSKNEDFFGQEDVWAGAGIGNGHFSWIMHNLDAGKTYYYKAYVRYMKDGVQQEAVGNVMTVTTTGEPTK